MLPMPRLHAARIVTTYTVSLAITIALLVVWVVYVVRSVSRIREMAGRMGVSSANPHWVILGIGCALFFLLIGGLTYQLAQALAARRYSQKQEEFVSNITHELKSPVAAIKLHAQTMQQPDLTAEDRSRSLTLVLQQTDRMGVLVDDVLESSRLLSRRHSLDLEPVELAPFFDAFFAETRLRIEGGGLQLTTEVSTDGSVLATPAALERVMTNLLDNAVTHSHAGGEVRCTVRKQGDLVVIAVEDDGIGILKGEHAKIFDRFYQVGREMRGRRRGTGLGLSIVSGLVAEMNGTVQAFSQEGRPGARFTVQLPLRTT